MHSNGLTGATIGQQRQWCIDSDWARWPCLFWLELRMMLLLWSSPIRLLKKHWFLLSTPCQRHKKEGELTSLIYGPLVNDDTPSTPFHTVPVHDTSISINSHHPSECSTVPRARQHGCVHNATAKWTCFLLFSNFFLSETPVADVRLLIESHFESGVYQSIGMGPKSGRLQWLQLCFMSFILLPLNTISLPHSHFSANQWVDIKCEYFYGIMLSSLICWSVGI